MARGGNGCDTAGCGNDAGVPIGPDVVNGSVPDVRPTSGAKGADVWRGGGGWGVVIEAIVGKEADVANGADVMVSSLIRRSDVGAGKSWVTRGVGTVGCGRPTEVLYGSKGSAGNSREIVLVGASAEDESMRTVSAGRDSTSTSG